MANGKYVGISKEDFHNLYNKENGFKDEVNKNHPAYTRDENFFDFILSGAKSLTKKEFESVVKS